MNLCEPIDSIDRWMESYLAEEKDKPLQDNGEPEWLAGHDYCEIDSGLDDPEILQAARDTLDFYINDERNSPQAPEFERQFRAFLHNNDYSYSPATIKHLISSVLGL